MTVWVSTEPESYRDIFELPERWTQIYDKEHAQSFRTLVQLKFDSPIVLRPGETRAL
jgi:hypothetical protein